MQFRYVSHASLFRLACILTVIFPVLLASTALADITLCIIAAAFLLHCRLQKDWGWLKESWVRILMLLWLYMIARGLFADQPKEALGRALPFVRYIVFAAALSHWTLTNTATHRRFYFVLFCAVVFCAGDGLLQYAAGSDLFFHPLIHDPNNGHIRLSGPFSKPILGIMLSWLAFPALLPMVFIQKRYRLPVIVGTLLTFATIALSGERMALLLALLGCAMAAVLLRARIKVLLAASLGILLFLAGLAFMSHDMFQRQVDSTAQTLSHWQQSPYGMLLKSDLAVAAQHPIFGVGAGQFKNACETLYAGDEAKITAMCNTHPHNIYLEWFIEEGAIGFALFVLFIAIVLKDGIRPFLREAQNPALAGLLIAFILRIWPLMSTTGFFSRWGAPPFWLVLGALLVYTTHKGAKNAGASLSL